MFRDFINDAIDLRAQALAEIEAAGATLESVLNASPDASGGLA